MGRFFRPVAKARHFSTIEKNSRVEVSVLPQHWNSERAKLRSVVRMVAEFESRIGTAPVCAKSTRKVSRVL